MFDIKNKPKNWYIELPKDDEKYHKLVLSMELETDDSYRIMDNSAKMIFKKRGGLENLELPCLPLNKYIGNQDGKIDFYIQLSLKNYTELESLRMDDHLEVKLAIAEMFLVPFFMSPRAERKSSQSATEVFFDYHLIHYTNSKPPIIIKYDTAKLNDCELLIMQDEWVERVIKPLGMGDRFIIEIPCKFPDIPEEVLGEPILEDLREKLELGITKLREAIDEYNRGKDREKCILKIREASDHLYEPLQNRNYEIKFKTGKPEDMNRLRSYSEYLIENTGTGSKEISNEMMQSIQIIINNIFDMASKVPHSRTRKREPFEYTPSFEDAEMILGIMSLIYYWMSVKFEKSMIKDNPT
jgi:hypothetical protein